MGLTYRAFGLAIGSELPLPGLPVTGDKPEIQIRRAAIPEWIGTPAIRYGDRCKIRGQEWWVRFGALPFEGLIQDGNLVQFEADPAQDDFSRLHLLGSCTGALLFQRGLVPLHGNTVVNSHGAAMLVGKVRAGKSATTFALLERGYRLVADDISGVSFEGKETNEPRVVPGFPRLKLWKNTLEHFQRDPGEFHKLRAGLDKFNYPVDDRFCPTPPRLKAIYVLQPQDSAGDVAAPVRLSILTGLAKLEALRTHLYKIRFHDAVRNWPPLLGKICRLADTVRVAVVERPREGVTIDAVAEAIEKDLSRTLPR